MEAGCMSERESDVAIKHYHMDSCIVLPLMHRDLV